MTLSREDRLENIDRAIQKLMTELGDCSIIMTLFTRGNHNYTDIFATTWDDIEHHGWIETEGSTMGATVAFRITGDGWVEGLERTGQLAAAVAKLSQLCMVAKVHVKGREEHAACHIEQLAEDSDLPRSFIENVVESGLLERQFPKRQMELRWWDPQGRPLLLRIPRSFGMERL